MTYIPRQLSARFPVEDLPEQFRLAPTPRNPAIAGWGTHELDGWTLCHHSSLPCIELHSDDVQVGWLLGYAVNGDGELLVDKVLLNRGDDPARWEAAMDEWGGRFAVVLLTVRTPRIYLDAVGALSIVYSGTDEMAASSPSLIPYSEWTGDDLDLIHALGIPDSKAMYLLGQTPRTGIRRLLPNHYLDLSRWTQVRHWPRHDIEIVPDAESAVREIGHIVQRQIGAVAKAFPLQIALTAGQDSRMLLAAARQHTDGLESFTLAIPDDFAAIDCQIARRLAKRAGIEHRNIEFVEASDYELEQWMFRIGCSAGEPRGWMMARMRRQLDPGRVELMGLVGEVSRGYYWRNEDFTSRSVSDQRLLQISRSLESAAALARIAEWRESLPQVDALTLLDLFYIEQRLGCWGGVLPYADAGTTAFRFFPLCHRRIISLMLALPHEFRFRQRFAPVFISQLWPDLLRLPFNERVGLAGLCHRLKTAASTAGRRLIKAALSPSWALERAVDVFRTPR